MYSLIQLVADFLHRQEYVSIYDAPHAVSRIAAGVDQSVSLDKRCCWCLPNISWLINQVTFGGLTDANGKSFYLQMVIQMLSFMKKPGTVPATSNIDGAQSLVAAQTEPYIDSTGE